MKQPRVIEMKRHVMATISAMCALAVALAWEFCYGGSFGWRHTVATAPRHQQWFGQYPDTHCCQGGDLLPASVSVRFGPVGLAGRTVLSIDYTGPACPRHKPKDEYLCPLGWGMIVRPPANIAPPPKRYSAHWQGAWVHYYAGAGGVDREIRIGLPLWAIYLGFVLYPATVVSTYRLRQHRRRIRHQCRTCGYSLTGNTSGTCSECGSLVGA